MNNRKIELDTLRDELDENKNTVYCGTDTSLPDNPKTVRIMAVGLNVSSFKATRPHERQPTR